MISHDPAAYPVRGGRWHIRRARVQDPRPYMFLEAGGLGGEEKRERLWQAGPTIALTAHHQAPVTSDLCFAVVCLVTVTYGPGPCLMSLQVTCPVPCFGFLPHVLYLSLWFIHHHVCLGFIYSRICLFCFVVYNATPNNIVFDLISITPDHRSSIGSPINSYWVMLVHHLFIYTTLHGASLAAQALVFFLSDGAWDTSENRQ
jgi:hypothetical protein